MTRRSTIQSSLQPCNVPIGGIQKLSLVDFPGHIAAALFTAGCNMRCGYCHNPELVLPERLAPSIPIDNIMLFLKSRTSRLDGVVVSGGEPTIHDDLPEPLPMPRPVVRFGNEALHDGPVKASWNR